MWGTVSSFAAIVSNVSYVLVTFLRNKLQGWQFYLVKWSSGENQTGIFNLTTGHNCDHEGFVAFKERTRMKLSAQYCQRSSCCCCCSSTMSRKDGTDYYSRTQISNRTVIDGNWHLSLWNPRGFYCRQSQLYVVRETIVGSESPNYTRGRIQAYQGPRFQIAGYIM